MAIEIPENDLLNELFTRNYDTYLFSTRVSTHNILKKSIDEAYAIGFISGQTHLKETQTVNTMQLALDI